MISRMIGIKAAVGPPICTRLPPSAEMMKPAMIAVKIPSAGAGNGVSIPAGTLAMPSARASGQRDHAHGDSSHDVMAHIRESDTSR